MRIIGGCKMKEINKGIKEVKENKREVKELIGGCKMKENKEVKELVRELEDKRMLLVETVFKWSQGLNPIKDVHIKIKGRYYPLLEKETGRMYVIDKVQGKKVPFDTLDQSMKFVIISVLAERKEQIEKEVEEDKKKYLEEKLSEINKLLNKF